MSSKPEASSSSSSRPIGQTLAGSVPPSIRWPIRYQPEEFKEKRAYVVMPRTESNATRAMRTFIDTAKERLGFEESDLPNANFIIVGDGTRGTPQPNRQAANAINEHSHRNNEMPIYSVSILELYQRLLDTRERQQAAGDEVVEEEDFVLQEELINGQMHLTMGEDFFRFAARNEDKAYDELGRKQLLKDDFVDYVRNLPIDEKQRLSKYLDNSPLRLMGTRWKVHMVLNRYLALAWELTGNTWKFVFHEEEFSNECRDFFGSIMPDDALRASVLAFTEDPEIYFS